MQPELIYIPKERSITEAPRPGLRESLYLRTAAGFELAGEPPWDPHATGVEPSVGVE